MFSQSEIHLKSVFSNALDTLSSKHESFGMIPAGKTAMYNSELPDGRAFVMRLVALAFLTIGLTWSTLGAEPSRNPRQAAAKLRDVRTEIATTRSNLFLTVEQLHKVKGASDPQAQFESFTNQLARMEERAQVTREVARKMQEKGDAYFADWEAQVSAISDPDRRRHVQSHYTQRKESYDLIKMFMKKAGKDFPPLVDALKKVRHLLEANRTPEKIQAAKDLFMNANWWCADLQRTLMQAELELDALASDFMQSSDGN